MASQVKRRGEYRTPADILGARVRARRADLGNRTQAELAEAMSALGHGWTHGTVSRIENGKAEPTLSELVGLMLTLGSTFEDLLDPVTTGGDPVDVGLANPLEASFLHDFLSGEAHFIWLQKSKAMSEEERLYWLQRIKEGE
jgi:transcriptional regulator with XRE-family HTH domain